MTHHVNSSEFHVQLSLKIWNKLSWTWQH